MPMVSSCSAERSDQKSARGVRKEQKRVGMDDHHHHIDAHTSDTDYDDTEMRLKLGTVAATRTTSSVGVSEGAL